MILLMMLLMMLMLSRVNKVCVLLFLRVSFVRDFWGRRKHWEEKFISVAVKVNAYIYSSVFLISETPAGFPTSSRRSFHRSPLFLILAKVPQSFLGFGFEDFFSLVER